MIGQRSHGYFEASPNHDAVAFRYASSATARLLGRDQLARSSNTQTLISLCVHCLCRVTDDALSEKIMATIDKLGPLVRIPSLPHSAFTALSVRQPRVH